MASHKLTKREKEILSLIFDALAHRRKMNEEAVLKKILKTKEIPNWNRIKNHLTNVLKEFILLHEITPNSPDGNHALVSTYYQKGLDKNYQASVKKGGKLLEQNGALDHSIAFYRFRLNGILVEEQIRKRKIEKAKLEDMARELDLFYVVNRLRMIYGSLTQQIIHPPLVEDDLFLENIPKIIKASKDLGALFSYQIYQLLTTPNINNYESLKANFEKNIEKFSLDFLEEVVLVLSNYCITKINLGQLSYGVDFR